MQQVEAILVLLAAVAALTTLARRLKVAYPILMVMAAWLSDSVPGLWGVRSSHLTNVLRSD